MNISAILVANGIVLGEIIFVTVIMAVSIIMWTYVDIEIHDFYVQPAAAECYVGNDSTFCQQFRALHGCPEDSTYNCLIQKYRDVIFGQMVYIGGLLFFIRMSLTKMMRRRFTSVRILSAMVWAASPILLLLFGWEDMLYYYTRNQPIPNELPWLDNLGLMPYINTALGYETTMALSLYILMFLGAVGIVGLFSLKSYAMKRADLKMMI